VNIPLPAAAFPIGFKAGPAAGFATAVLIGLTLYLVAKNKQQPAAK